MTKPKPTPKPKPTKSREAIRARNEAVRIRREAGKVIASAVPSRRHDASAGAWGDWRDVFLQTLREHASVRKACQAAGINRSTAYEARSLKNAQTDKDKTERAQVTARVFAAAWDEALEDANDLLEEEARRRAVEGVTRERYDKEGQLIAVETEYSDQLLTLLLKANKKSKFGERAGSANVNVNWDDLTSEQLERIAAGEDVLSVIAGARAS